MAKHHKWLYGWVGQRGMYMSRIRNRAICENLDALLPMLHGECQERREFNLNGDRPRCADLCFARADKKGEFLFKIYDRLDDNPHLSREQMDEMVGRFDEILAAIKSRVHST